jgi:hypothetical protein
MNVVRETDLQAIQAALALRQGGMAEPTGWELSHSWFFLKVYHPRLAGNVLLLCAACERVEFDNRIRDCNIQLEAIDGDRVRVSDGSRLLVVCGGVELNYNVPPLFEIPKDR